MARQLIVKSMAPTAVDRAYAVARNGAAGLSLRQWRRYAGALIERRTGGRGLLSVENPAGTILGLCGYRIAATPRDGTICSVEFLVALDLLDCEAVMSALLGALEERARRQGATGLRLDLPYGTAATTELLRRLDQSGHRIERIGLLKSLSATGQGSTVLRRRNQAG